MNTTTLKLQGMSCASCANNIEQAIQTVPGVTQASVNFGAEQATVTYDAQRTDLEAIQDAVKEAGYSAFSLQESAMVKGEDDAEKTARLAESRDLNHKVWVGASISTVLLLGSLPMMTGLNLPLIPAWLHNFWFQQWSRLRCNSGKALKRHTATMDTLIALGGVPNHSAYPPTAGS